MESLWRSCRSPTSRGSSWPPPKTRTPLTPTSRGVNLGLTGGSDGIRYRIRYTPGLGPGYQPAVVRADRMLPPRRADAGIAAGLAIAAPAGSLREKARQLGVSHEAVRQAMRAAGVPTDLEARNARIRAMAETGAPWPKIAVAFGLSPSGVRRVYRDLPPRRSGPRPRAHAEHLEGPTRDP